MELCHQLVEIPPKDWPHLQRLFARNWPEHILGFSIVGNYIEWLDKSGRSEIKHLKLFSLDGDWQSDGTFLVIDRYQVLLYSLESSASTDAVTRLEIALSLLDWSKGFKVSSFSSKHRQSVVRVVESRRLEREFDSETVFYHLPKERANDLPLIVPDDVRLHPLREVDVPLAESLWPNRHSGSLFFLRRLRRWSPNVGAYKMMPDGREILMGWCFILQSGAMGALQVCEEFQGQGIGTLVTVAMAKMLSGQGKDSFGFVGLTNWPSRKIFERLQFESIDRIHWLRTFPVGEKESVWERDSESDL